MGIITADVRDVLTFAQLHLDEGKSQSGAQIVSSSSILAMQEPQIDVPDPYTLGSPMGTWDDLVDWDGHRLYGHDGGTVGQSSRLRILPEAGVAITLLTNGGNADPV